MPRSSDHRPPHGADPLHLRLIGLPARVPFFRGGCIERVCVAIESRAKEGG